MPKMPQQVPVDLGSDDERRRIVIDAIMRRVDGNRGQEYLVVEAPAYAFQEGVARRRTYGSF
jgi:hypothetical protein